MMMTTLFFPLKKTDHLSSLYDDDDATIMMMTSLFFPLKKTDQLSVGYI